MTTATATATPTTADTASPNKVTVEDAGPARKRINITIPAEVIASKLNESISTLAAETVLPGFRKGKVPVKLLEKRFGSNVRTETKNQLIASAYAAAIEEHKIKPIGEPEPGEGLADLQLEPGKDLKFSLEVEVLPEFELPKGFDEIEIKKPMLEITSEHIENKLKRQQMMHGEASKIESDFTENDRLIGYSTVTRNDEPEPFFRQDNVVILYPGEADGGKGQLLGLMIDNLRGLLKGKNIGDTITVETTGPEAHEREDIRGAKLAMTFEIRGAQRITPAPPATVAERYGIPSEDLLREQIKFALEHRRDEEQASAMREQAIDALAEQVDFELPEKISAQQAASALEQMRLEMLQRGLSPEEAEEKLADIRTDSEHASRERLKRFFLLQRLAEHFKIEVSEQEVNGRIAMIAAQRNIRPERLRAELAQANRLNEVARMIRDQKAADRLVQQAKKVEISSDEWNELFKGKQKEKAGKGRSSAGAKKSTSKTKAGDDDKPTAKAEAPKTKRKAAAASDDDDDEKPAAKKKTTKKK